MMNTDQLSDDRLTINEGFVFDQEILDAFINEAKEHLQDIEQDFLALEKQTDDPDQNLIDKVFRAIHSIKGSAGFMQFTKIAELTNMMEALLQKMRAGEIKPESRYIDALLKGCDLLNNMIENVKNSENADIANVCGCLSDLLADNSPSSKNEQAVRTSQNQAEAQEKKRVAEEDSAFDQEMFDIFVAESKEHLEDIEQDFLTLENQASDPDQTLIDKVFRAIHSIKGGAGMLKLEKTSKLSHTMEALLQKMRSGEICPESKYVEVLLAGCDLLNQMIDHIRESEETDIQGVHDRLLSLLNRDMSSTSWLEPEKKSVLGVKKPADVRKSVPAAKNHRDHSDTVRIKVDLLNLLMTLAGELVLVRNQHLLTVDDLDPGARNISQRMDMVTTQLQEAIMRTRMQPVGNLFAKLPRIVRDVSKKIGKAIQIHTTGDEVELDKTILETLSDPLTHIIRNSCDHGIEMPDERYRMNKPEMGMIDVRAFHEAGQINIVIQDDGKGIDPRAIKEIALRKGLKSRHELSRMNERDVLSLIMMPGFSTSEKLTEISGRGVGMDVVKSSVEQQGGSIEMNSEKGEGTTIHLRLPLTLAIIPCLIVEVGRERYAIPKVSVDELVCLYDDEVHTGIEYAGVQEVCRLRGTLLPIVRMEEILNSPEKFTEETRSEITEKYSRIAQAALNGGERIRQVLLFAVVKIGMQRFGLVVDRVMGSEEIVVNPIHPKLKSLAIYSGTTIMGDGTVALILDIHGIAEHTGVEFISGTERVVRKRTSSDESDMQRVLIFENGEQERFAVPLPLIRRVQEMSGSQIEMVGTKEYVTIDGASALILRLDRLLNVSPCVETDRMYLLLPRHTSRAFGILMSRLVDVVPVPLTLNEDSHVEDGILGTAIVQDRMTLFPDIWRLFEKAASCQALPHLCETHEASEAPAYKILLVEDAVFFRRLVKSFLESRYEVKAAENGMKALDLMEETDFDLIVSDIEMPEMDGWAFLEQVRSLDKHRHIPAIALTTLDSPEDQARMRRVGFNAHEKKIDRERLLKIVAQLLQGQTC